MRNLKRRYSRYYNMADYLPKYRLEAGKDLTLAWDPMVYGEPTETNVRRFIERFREKRGINSMPRGIKTIVDQCDGKTVLQIKE